MSLSPGARLGPYEIVAAIGAGGMGEVYRARDTRLKRDVAIKILPDALASDPERLARFQREAQVLASLNHPHIAAIYGFEESGTTRGLVLELVEGATLAERIAQGPIPVDDALQLARQIAEALAAAHEQGILHRDLKPANIKLTRDGTVKVLDFGLAKAVGPAEAGHYLLPGSDLSASPTITSPAMTMGGVILGTAAYMSPEQAKGKAVDRRTDIWAFGCVLYEMLTGTRAFQGEDVTDVLAGIIKDEPDWALLPSSCRRLLQACLRKDMKTRLRDIGDVWELLDGTAPNPPTVTLVRKRTWLMLSGTATVALLLVAAFATTVFRTTRPADDPIRFQIAPPAQGTVLSLAVSPDGRRIALVVQEADGEVRLWIRPLDTVDFRPLTVDVSWSGASGVFWSPNSRFVALWVGGDLKKVDVSSGAIEGLASGSGAGPVGVGAQYRGGAWNLEGTIIFARRGPILRMPAAGGDPAPVTKRPDSAREFHSYPSFLPDGQRFLYLRDSPNAASSGVFVGDIRLPPEQQSTTRLLPIASPPVFVPGDSPRFGELLFIRNGSLMTQRFDVERLELIGESVGLADDMTNVGSPLYSASSSRVLAFRRGAALSQEKRLLIHDRTGKLVGQIGAPADYRSVMLSADGRFVAVGIAGQHVWAGLVTRGVLSRLIPGDAPDSSPAVSSTGQVAFSYALDGALGDIYVASVNSAAAPELWVKSDEQKHPNHFSHDGSFLMYDSHHATRRQDLWIVRTSGDRKPIPFLTTPADETFGQFSPDGKWVAYSSDESGRRDVYVQGFTLDRALGRHSRSSRRNRRSPPSKSASTSSTST